MSESSYEERIIQAALRLADAGEDHNAAGEAMSEIVLCARGMKRRKQSEDGEARRVISESHVEYDDGEKP